MLELIVGFLVGFYFKPIKDMVVAHLNEGKCDKHE